MRVRVRGEPRLAVDTSALLALMSPRDQYHAHAARIARSHVELGGRFVGSVLVLAELHGHLLRWRGAPVAHDLVDRVRRDSAYEWHGVDAPLLEAVQRDWFARLGGARISLTDAVTFELMRREKLTTAFAFDQDFELAGYALAA
jgi:predicted nucleic acid-binding protein